MRRKIGLHGRSTHTISLPREWIKRYGLAKGDELEVEITGNSLRITTEADLEAESCTIDLKELTTITPKIVSALYKGGYDDIRIIYHDQGQLRQIKDAVEKGFIGCEIIDEAPSSVRIRKVSRINLEEFNSMLKRTFQTILTMGNDIVEALEMGKIEELRSIKGMDEQVNKLTEFCRRALNKQDIASVKRPKPMYYIIEELEKAGDCYKDLCKAMMKSNAKRWASGCLPLLREINSYFRGFYTLHYSFELEDAQSFFDRGRELVKAIDNEMMRSRREMLPAIRVCYRLLNVIYSMSVPLLLLNL